MKILFTYPALACVVDTPRLTLDQITVDGIGTVYVYRAVNLYLDTKERIARFTGNDPRNVYLLEVAPGIISPVATSPNDDHFKTTCNTPAMFGPSAGKTPIEYTPEILAAKREVLADPEGWTTRRQAEKLVENERRAVEDAEKKERRERERKQAELDARAHARETFASGAPISWAQFEDLCLAHEVALPIQTIGSARKHISTVCRTGWTIAPKCKANPAPAIRELERLLEVC